MIQFRRVLLGLAVAALPLFAGCSSSTTTPPPPAAQSFVYYTLDQAGTLGNAQIGLVNYPITATSVLATTLATTATNGLIFTQNMAFDSSGRLFVVNEGTPNTVTVFTPPLTATSNPSIVLTLPAAITGAFGIAFDSGGSLWIGDFSNDKIYQFLGPFNASATLVANVTMVSPADPCGITFDAAGNLWEGLDTTPNGVTEFVKGAGFTNATVATVFLDGLADPCSVAFDKAGNLYAGGDPPKAPKSLARHARGHASTAVHPAIVEGDGIGFWPPANQINGGLPTIVNSTGLLTGFFSEQITFDTAGNLYDADCGTTGQIYVFPTATSAWSATLAPVLYTDANINTADCVEGIAIH
jgi:hypothetical protein